MWRLVHGNDEMRLERIVEGSEIDYGKKSDNLYLYGNVKGDDYYLSIEYNKPHIQVQLSRIEDGGEIYHTLYGKNTRFDDGSVAQALVGVFHVMKIKVPYDGNSELDLNYMINVLMSKYKFKEKG